MNLFIGYQRLYKSRYLLNKARNNDEKKLLKQIAVVIAVIVIGIFFFRASYTIINQFSHQKIKVYSYPYLMGAVALTTVSFFLSSLIWRAAMIYLGEKVSVRDGFRVVSLSLASRYIPGGVWPIFTQLYLSQKKGFSKQSTLTAIMLQSGTAIISGLLLGAVIGASLIIFFKLHPAFVVIIAGILALFIL